VGKGSTERGGRTDVRQRRALQRLGQDPFSLLGVEAGDGIVLDSALGTITVDLATDPGLAFSSGDLIVIVGSGLELTATGIEIDLLASGGLAFSSGDLTVDLRDATPALELTANGVGVIVGNGLELTASGVEIDLGTNPGLAFSTGDLTALVGAGLELTASGIEIDLATNPGLAFSSGDLIVTVGAGLELTATGVEIGLATDPGLEFDSGDLRVKIKAAGGITRDADGLSTSGGGSSGFDAVTATAFQNVASVTSSGALWIQQGVIVTVAMRLNIQATNASVKTSVLVTLPVAPATNFSSQPAAFGAGNAQENPDDGVAGVVFSQPSTSKIQFRYWPTVNGVVHLFHIVFSYTVDPP